MYKMGVSLRKIAKKYSEHFQVHPENLKDSIRTHMVKKHAPVSPLVVDPIINPGVGVKNTGRDIEGFAAKMLEIGNDLVNNSPDKITMGQVIASQRLLLEKKKLKLDEQQMLIGMAKMFGGFSGPVIEGEEVKQDGEQLAGI